jgi:hypothetical protein
MRDSPLGKGNEHLVFHGHMVHMEKDQVKKLKTDSRDQFCLNNEQTFEVVLKVNMTSNCDVYPKLEIYAAVKYLSNKFNEMNRVHNLEFVNVEVISPFIVHVGHNTKYMGSEKKIFVTPRKVSEFSILGEYSLTKYSSDYHLCLKTQRHFSFIFHFHVSFTELPRDKVSNKKLYSGANAPYLRRSENHWMQFRQADHPRTL